MNNSLPGDDKLVAVFKLHPVPNKAASKEAGRPIFDDVEICEIRIPGSRTGSSVHPATEVSHKHAGFFDTEERTVTYAERFSSQYREFKANVGQTMHGTPLDQCSFLTPGKKAEMRALNVYTLEQLAAIDGAELKNLGPGGRELKNQAQAFIDDGLQRAPNVAAMEELEQLRARNVILEEDSKALLELKKQQRDAEEKIRDADRFDQMTLDQLRDYIQATTGKATFGSLNRNTLMRMARNAEKGEAA